jgi:hypothetical protein
MSISDNLANRIRNVFGVPLGEELLRKLGPLPTDASGNIFLAGAFDNPEVVIAAQNTGNLVTLKTTAVSPPGTVLTATNLKFLMQAGVEYAIQALLLFSESVAADGVQFDFGGGVTTGTFYGTCSSGGNAAGAPTPVTTFSGSPTTPFAYSALADTNVTPFVLTASAFSSTGGVLQLRVAANSSTGAVSLNSSSWLLATPLVAQ